ncbi:MAG: hypothetical protein AABZ60_07260, partial [Planctomycetota bacterium]
MKNKLDLKPSEKILIVLMKSSISCIFISLFFGIFGALYYIPFTATFMLKANLSLIQLRPLHTTFASAWIYLGAITYIYKYLFDS